MKLRLSIRSKLFIAILLTLLVTHVTLLATTIKSVDSFITRQVAQELAEHLKYAQQMYIGRAELVKNAILQPASAQPVQKRVLQKDSLWLRDALKRWRNNLPFIDVLVLVDGNKKMMVEADTKYAGKGIELPLTVERVFREKRPIISSEIVTFAGRDAAADPVLARLIRNSAMMETVVVPIIGENGSVIGAVVAGDILNGDNYLPDQIKKTYDSETELTITQGTIPIVTSLKEDLSRVTMVDVKTLERLHQGQPHLGEANIGDKQFLTVFEPINNDKGTCIGSLALSLSLESYNRIRLENGRNLLLSALLGVLLSFVIAYITAGQLTRPVLALAQGSRRIAGGELQHRVEIKDGDEFGLLADSFNSMAVALAERDRTISKKTSDLEVLNVQLEQKVAERTAELQVEMRRLEAILTSMVEGIVVTDRDNRVILFNPAAQRLFNLVPHRVLHQPVEEVCSMGEFCPLAEFVRGVNDGSLASRGVEKEISMNGKQLKVTISLLPDEENQFAGVVMSIRDVTAEEEVDRMKNEFISTVSHELKTPLTSIKGSLQYIIGKGRWPSGVEQQLLEVCLRNTDRLIRMINDILDISKIEAGKVEFDLRPQSISELVVYSLDELKGFSLHRAVTVVNDVDSTLPLVYGDHDRLVQVLTNLLANAVKFSPPDALVRVTAKREGNYVAVSICDSGSTIQVAERDKLFNKFQQLHRPDLAERGGTGLGLAICKEIIEQHYGKIYYEPGANGGNIFTFTVPVFEA